MCIIIIINTYINLYAKNKLMQYFLLFCNNICEKTANRYMKFNKSNCETMKY